MHKREREYKMSFKTNVIKLAMLSATLTMGFAAPTNSTQKEEPSPFSLFLVPAHSQEEPYGRGISMATENDDYFYVILTNISKETQFAFEGWNSWGYNAISFEIETEDGRKHTISKALSKKLFFWTINWPQTFLIPPGESMVRRILLDDYWGADPDLPIANRTPIQVTIKAIYQLEATPESAAKNMWTGRLESRRYNIYFRHGILRSPSER
jgi:hypothetical protein